MPGTLLNVVAIVMGGAVGALLGDRLPARVRGGVTDVIGVFVLVLGASDALTTFGDELRPVLGRASVLVVLGSLVIGGVIGELMDVERRLTWLGERLRDLVLRSPEPFEPEPSGPDRVALEEPHPPHDPRHRFVEGFVIASLVVCIGPLAILGSLQDGLSGDIQLLAVKSVLDGFIVLALASALGIGPAFSALPLLAVQGSITLAAAWVAPVITEPMIAAVTATGGFLVVGLALRLLEVREVRVANLLPALLLAPAAVAAWPG
jgi:uncharacterized protein